MKEVLALSGKFQKDKYIANNSMDRINYINEIHRAAERKEYSFFTSLGAPYIKHIDRQYTVNLYFRDWPRVMRNIKNFYGEGMFIVVNGFRSPFELGVNAHSTGLAVDILVESKEEADRLMNAAYLAGVPTIIPVGDIEEGQGHIHLDLAPKPSYAYDAGTYTGPWGDMR